MEKSIVALVRCESYNEEEVYNAVSSGMELLGGFEAFIKKDEKVLLKPNFLGKAAPEKAVTTHPSVFGAVARLLREAGYSNLSYGDSPGNPTASPGRVSETSGVKSEAAKYGIGLANFDEGSAVEYPEGRMCRSFLLCKGVQEADAIINLPKMKTHALERITGAMKNMYGCVHGTNKAAGHVRFPNSFVFADMLADLNGCTAPRLHIMDGITAMEGNGPTSGVPIAMNVLLFSADPVALDSVFASLVYLPPEDVPTCVSGAETGLGVMDEDSIVVRTMDGELTLSQAAELYGNPKFDVFRDKITKNTVESLLPLLPFLQDRPRVKKSLCVGCGICQQVCPVPGKAVHSGGGRKASYDYRKCIRCFCCQEMCPKKAISVYHSPLNKLLGSK